VLTLYLYLEKCVTTVIELHRDDLAILGRLSGKAFYCFEAAYDAELKDIYVTFQILG
jgi:hypothetical protein